jgi:hydroxymethylpyrimidine pyrophosphatase-like HAD family hydrolase
MQVTFATDLGDTILYKQQSSNDIDLKRENVESSSTFLTEASYGLLKEIQLNQNIVFIVCSARTYEDIQKLEIVKNADFIISSFGAEIHSNRIKDEEWYYSINSRIELDEMKEVYEELRGTLLYLATVENKKYYLKIKSDLINNDLTGIVKSKLDPYEGRYKMFNSKNKVYIVPYWLNKRGALEYIVKKYKLENLIVSGNSLIDREFLNIKNSRMILPCHANESLFNQSSIVTKSTGMQAGEEILRYVLKEVSP